MSSRGSGWMFVKLNYFLIKNQLHSMIKRKPTTNLDHLSISFQTTSRHQHVSAPYSSRLAPISGSKSLFQMSEIVSWTQKFVASTQKLGSGSRNRVPDPEIVSRTKNLPHGGVCAHTYPPYYFSLFLCGEFFGTLSLKVCFSPSLLPLGFCVCGGLLLPRCLLDLGLLPCVQALARCTSCPLPV